MKKTTCSILCAMLLLHVLIPFGAVTVCGTEENEVHIQTAAELIAFSQSIANNSEDYYSGKTVYLDADVTVNEGDLSAMTESQLEQLTAWGNVTGDKSFQGTFDGRGHRISGIYFAPTGTKASGLFGGTGCGGATVKNLSIVNSVIVANGRYNGGLFGSISGDITLSDLYVDVDLKNAQSYSGGLLGYVSSSDAEVTVTSCVYAGTVESAAETKQFGGILGCHGRGTVTLRDCAFTGSITGEGTTVGGLVGGVYQTGLSITNCISTGELTASESAALLGWSKNTVSMTNNLYTQSLEPVVLETGGAISSETAAPSYRTVTAAELTGTAAITTLSQYGLSAWKGGGHGVALPATVWEMVYAPEEVTADAPTKFVGYQIAEGIEGETVHLRLIAVVDSADHEAVGFSVTLENPTMGEKAKDHRTQTVYGTLTGYETETGRVDYTAKSLGGAYIYALNVKNIPVANGTYQFTVSTYHVTNGEPITDGEPKSFALDCSPWQEVTS